MFLELDHHRPHPLPRLQLWQSLAPGEVQFPGDVELGLDQLPHRPLTVPPRPVLLQTVEHQIVPRVGVQLPGLLLEVLHHPGDVGQLPEELLLEETVLLPGLRQLQPQLVDVSHQVTQGVLHGSLGYDGLINSAL